MNTLFKKAGLGCALAATALTAAAPADAQRYRRYHRGGGDAAAGAIIGGIVGLGLGAAIASSNRDRYYDRGYYRPIAAITPTPIKRAAARDLSRALLRAARATTTALPRLLRQIRITPHVSRLLRLLSRHGGAALARDPRRFAVSYAAGFGLGRRP